MASKKGKAAKGKARRAPRRGSRISGSASLGGVSWFLVGAIITFGGVILAKLCKLPAWLSPVGAALWLFGWWKGNAMLRALGLLYIGVGLAALMGLPEAAAQGMDKIKAGGGIFGLFGAADGTTPGAPKFASNAGGGSSLDELVEDVVNTADAVTAVRTAFA